MKIIDLDYYKLCNRISVLPIFFGILFTIGCKDPIEEKCISACDFFVYCSVKANKKKKFGEEMKNLAKIHCLDGCTRNHVDILSCYEEAGDTCDGMGECLLQSGLAE